LIIILSLANFSALTLLSMSGWEKKVKNNKSQNRFWFARFWTQ
jgi:hypothetical protein